MPKLSALPGIALLVAALAGAACAGEPAPAQQPQAATYETVNIDEYAAKHRPVKSGTRTLLPPKYITFDAHLDQPPRKARTDYLKLALSVLKVADAPEINHQMLLASASGMKLPVYVEDVLVSAISNDPSARVAARFYGYHIYTYSKGPAIVVSGFRGK